MIREHGSESMHEQEKLAQWEEARAKVEQMKDRLGKSVDGGIKETVVGLNVSGINTTASCEGHVDWGEAAPWVDVETAELPELEERLHVVKSEEEGTAIVAEITRKNLEERRKLIEVLGVFYRDREVPYDERLIIHSLARGWSRLESQGIDMQKIAEPNERQEKLEAYQREMRTFTEFLRGKFFSS